MYYTACHNYNIRVLLYTCTWRNTCTCTQTHPLVFRHGLCSLLRYHHVAHQSPQPQRQGQAHRWEIHQYEQRHQQWQWPTQRLFSCESHEGYSTIVYAMSCVASSPAFLNYFYHFMKLLKSPLLTSFLCSRRLSIIGLICSEHSG